MANKVELYDGATLLGTDNAPVVSGNQWTFSISYTGTTPDDALTAKCFIDGVDVTNSSNLVNVTVNAATQTIQPETTAYMNAIAVPNDSTVYYPGTAQEKTGAQVWTLINDVITFYKDNGVWANIETFYPRFGDTAAMLKYNAKDTAAHIQEFVGTWAFTSLGMKADGSTALVRNDIFIGSEADKENIAVSLACNSNEATTGADIGVYNLYLKLRDGSGNISGTAYSGNATRTAAVTTAEGITAIGNVKNAASDYTQNIVKNGVVLDTLPFTSLAPGTGSTFTLTTAAYDTGSGYGNYTNRRYCSELFINAGDAATLQLIQQGQDMLEAGLGRKTWT